jgi:hypothetical protein
MAEEEKKKSAGSDFEMVWFVFGGLAVLIFIWWMTGGPERADLRGIFLSPPPEVGGTGEAYGPQVGEPNPNINQ